MSGKFSRISGAREDLGANTEVELPVLLVEHVAGGLTSHYAPSPALHVHHRPDVSVGVNNFFWFWAFTKFVNRVMSAIRVFTPKVITLFKKRGGGVRRGMIMITDSMVFFYPFP